MKNKGLAAYKSNSFVDRKYFLNPDFFDSELLTIVKAKYVNEDLVVEFQKVNGRSVLYTFIDEHAKREFIADVVGYYPSNPCPRSFMRLENMFGKRVEGFFDRSNKRLASVAPIFHHCDDKKYKDSLSSRVLNDKKGKELSESNLTEGLSEIQEGIPYDPEDFNLHNPGYPFEDSEYPWGSDSFGSDNFYDPNDLDLHNPGYPGDDNLLEDMFGE